MTSDQKQQCGLTGIRIFSGLLWFGIITFAAVFVFLSGLDTNTQGSVCSSDMWREGMIYQWVSDNTPCTFTANFWIGYYFYLMLYLLYDYVRRKIMRDNPALGWRGAEVLVWFALGWGSLLWLTATDYGSMNLTLAATSFAGMLLFFLPLFITAFGVKFLSSRIVLWSFAGMAALYALFILFALNFLV